MAKYNINVCIIGGNLTRDPELRYTPAGKAVCEFTIANNQGEYNGQEDTNFISVVVWGKQAESAANYLRKGREVIVEGRWNQRSYDNNEGKRVYVHELVATRVQFVGGGNGEGGNGGGNGNAGGNNNYSGGNGNGGGNGGNGNDPYSGGGGPIDISEDDLPF